MDVPHGYSGGLIAVSHDDAFLDRLGIDGWIHLTRNGLSLGPRLP